jgi:hypothetical protein
MLRPLARALLSAVIAVCFSAGTVAQSGMPTCASAQAHHQGASHGHSGHDGRPAGGTHCVVHLCCAHMAPEPPVGLAAAPLSEPAGHPGLAAATAAVPGRPQHALPFAQAPPRYIA